MPELKALIFDVDGTLADTERNGHRVAFNRAFKEAGLDWNWDEELYGHLLKVTGGKERIQFFADEFLEHFQWPSDPTGWIAHLHKNKTRFYLEMLEQGKIQLRSGVRELIEEARTAGLVLAIATTTTPANVTYLLNATLGVSATQWFSVIAAGDIVAAKKPAADIYDLVLGELCMEASECVAFEDSDKGLLSSRAAGIGTIVITNSYTSEQDMTGAELVIDKWGTKNDSFNVIAGDAGTATILDLNLVRKIHRRRKKETKFN